MSRRKRLVLVLPWALLAGLLLALAVRGQAEQAVFGCRPGVPVTVVPPSEHPLVCATKEQGYPVWFQSYYAARYPTMTWLGGVAIDKAALIEDWLVWSLVSGGVLYVLAPTASNARARFRSQSAT
jgi:hypothetical protein